MYAVIQTGGKQYRVQEGDVLRVEKLDAEIGKKVNFDQVLMIGDGGDVKAGKDVEKFNVSGVVTEQGKGKKVVIFKRRRRKTFRRTMGHRQMFTAVRIDQIGESRAAATKAETTAKAETVTKAKPATKTETTAKAKPAAKAKAATKAETTAKSAKTATKAKAATKAETTAKATKTATKAKAATKDKE